MREKYGLNTVGAVNSVYPGLRVGPHALSIMQTDVCARVATMKVTKKCSKDDTPAPPPPRHMHVRTHAHAYPSTPYAACPVGTGATVIAVLNPNSCYRHRHRFVSLAATSTALGAS
ncbi:unnamed protein product [Schistocephalus solidus]|uniref:Uncharacterized protein n=1 Tax=Schistocephalus solidus TaxID=70667 RepID=A0A183TK83_SCHSO|nr:unnamed protein product [Schistocephalus solidus]